MRKKLMALWAVAALAFTVLPAAAVAEEEPPLAQSVYLSLGTSLAAGTQADELGNNILFTNESYTDQLQKRLNGELNMDAVHVKLGCPGETTETFTNGGICYTGGLSQLSLAQFTLASGDVELVTIDMGANDFLEATPAIEACPNEGCVKTILAGIAADVGATIDAIRAVDPDVPIIAMNYYNPNVAAWLGYFAGVPGQHDPDPEFAFQSSALSELGNDLIEEEYAARGVPVADVESVFESLDFSGDPPANVSTVCKWTYMCPENAEAAPNIHANKKGYKKIASAFWRIVVDLGLNPNDEGGGGE